MADLTDAGPGAGVSNYEVRLKFLPQQETITACSATFQGAIVGKVRPNGQSLLFPMLLWIAQR